MKRKISFILLALVLCLSIPFCAHAAGADSLIYDEAQLLTGDEAAQLNAKLLEVGQACEAQIVVATVASVEDGDVDAYVEAFYDTMNLGYGENRDGVLLLVSMEPRQYRILSNGYAGDAIDPDVISVIGDIIVDDLSAGSYASAFNLFADQCAYYLDGYLNGFPFDLGGTLLIVLPVGALVGIIVAFVLKGQLKSVRQQNQANVYIKSGSMQVAVRNDLFLYRTVNRTRKESSKSSGSKSGSSRSVGGGSF